MMIMMMTAAPAPFSALARAGKSVLVLDPGDTYGDSWAGVSGDQLQRCAGVGSRAAADQAGADAGAGASATAAAAAAGCRPLTNDDSAVTFSLNKPHLSSFSGAAAHHRLRLWPGGAEALAHRTTLIDRAPKVLTWRWAQSACPWDVLMLPVGVCACMCMYTCMYVHTHVWVGGMQQRQRTASGTVTTQVRRSCCRCIHSQVLYQAEPIVNALVAVGAHHYLDFRLLDGR